MVPDRSTVAQDEDRGARETVAPAATVPIQGRWDLFAAAGLTLAAALAVLAEPDGSTVRLVLTLPILFLVPGYLLIQALVVPAPTGTARRVQMLLAVGVSPAVVGLLALATTLLPGGFKAASIVVIVTVVSLALMVVSYFRRSWVERTATRAVVAA